MRLIGLLLALSSIAVPPADAARRARDQAPRLVVVEVNGEPALRRGRETIGRPFGGVLVDRIDVIGSYALRGGRAWLVRGAAAGRCPAHFLILGEHGGALRPSPVFGTCAAAVRARTDRGGLEILVASTTPGEAPARWRYAGGRLSMLAAAAPANAGGAAPHAPDDPIAGWAGPGGCALPGRVAPAEAERLLADFARAYPQAWRRHVDRVALTPGELRRIVTALACLSPWPAADPAVPRAALPLFASDRHGRRAFELLDGIARDAAAPSDLRAAARTFHADMRFHVDRRRG